MIGRLLRKLSPIGLELCAEGARAVQLERRAGRWSVFAAANVPRVKPGAALNVDEAERLVSVLDRRGFRFGRIVAAAPPGAIESAVLELPGRASGAPVEQIARGEMARSLKCDAAALEVGVWELPLSARHGALTAAGPTGTMVVACRTSEADALVESMSGAGADVVAIDAPCLALARACEPWLTGGAINTVLEIGATCARAVVTFGQTVIYERSLPEGSMANLRSVLATHLRVEPEIAEYLLTHDGVDAGAPSEDAVAERWAEARRIIADRTAVLVSEVRTSIAYAGGRFHGSPTGRLLLTGDGARAPSVVATLTEGVGIETRVVRPSDTVDVPRALNEVASDPSLAMATGLALWREEDAS